MSQWADELYQHLEAIERHGIPAYKSIINNPHKMTEKTSKVLNVQANGSFDSQYGTFYKFEVDFENGDGGQYSAKTPTQNKFVVGQETTYTIEQKGQFFNVKPVATNSFPAKSFGGGSKSPEESRRIARMNALTNAVNSGTSGKDLLVSDILIIASSFEAFIMEGTESK